MIINLLNTKYNIVFLMKLTNNMNLVIYYYEYNFKVLKIFHRKI